jgi:hypothetical protein
LCSQSSRRFRAKATSCSPPRARKSELFGARKSTRTGDSRWDRSAEIAGLLGMTEGAAHVAIHRVLAATARRSAPASRLPAPIPRTSEEEIRDLFYALGS